MFLAQIIWESGGLVYVSEIRCMSSGCPGEYETMYDYPGARYYGRAYIQLSWYYNYRDASLSLYNDLRLFTNPDQVAKNDEISWAVTFWYWKQRVHSQPGVSLGYFGITTKAINGGLECNGGPYVDRARKRFEIYKNILVAFNIRETPIELGCY